MASALPTIEIRPTIEQLMELVPTNTTATCTSPIDDSNKTCPICKRSFRNRGSKKFHMRKTHNEEMDSINTILGLKPSAYPAGAQIQFHCPFGECSDAGSSRKGCYKDAKLLIQHFQKTHMEKRHKCTKCLAKFALQRDLRYHQKKICPKRQESDFGVIDGEEDNIDNPSTTKQQQSVGIQTDSWLIPTKISLIGRFRKIRPKNVAPTKKSISIQTDDPICGNLSGVDDEINKQYALANRAQQQNTYFYDPCESVTQLANQEGGMNGEYRHHQYENSYAQTSTIFAPTNALDFGAQCSSTTTNYSSAIYLNPIQVASSMTQTQPMVPMFDDNNDGGLYFHEPSSIRDFGTQTPPAAQQNCFPSWMPLELSTVAAQTDEVILNTFD